MPASAEPVALDGFALDRTEVTVGAFAAYLAEAGTETTAEREGGGFEWGAGWERRAGWTYAAPQGTPAAPDEPAVHVTWHEAQAFCAAQDGRLPTREEWAAAAYTERRATPQGGFRTGQTYAYPVGDTPEGMNNNRRGHVSVGTTKPGVNGLFDMGGNVWEWLADRRDGDALTAGGSWWYGPAQTRISGMQWKPADFYAVYVGFRCAYDPGGQ
ncbi:formylglycine-generating enzyme family protein [Cognatishimia sp. F0-27]|nr:formylglycine-generating enzyme family protein [Cognatishimia sp. F0-27]